MGVATARMAAGVKDTIHEGSSCQQRGCATPPASLGMARYFGPGAHRGEAEPALSPRAPEVERSARLHHAQGGCHLCHSPAPRDLHREPRVIDDAKFNGSGRVPAGEGGEFAGDRNRDACPPAPAVAVAVAVAAAGAGGHEGGCGRRRDRGGVESGLEGLVLGNGAGFRRKREP